MMFPGAKTLVVTQVASTDDGLGNSTDTETVFEWPGCMVAPRSAQESSDPSVSPLVVGVEVYSDQPPPVTIDINDQLSFDGHDWRVEGIPAEWPWPAGGMAGYVVQLRRA